MEEPKNESNDEVTLDKVNAVLVEMAEPDPGPRRDALAAHLKAGGSIKASKTEKGIRRQAVLEHMLAHVECDEGCAVRMDLEKRANELSGPELEYEINPGTFEHVALFVTKGIERLVEDGYVDANFPMDMTEVGRRELDKILATGWTPSEDQVRSVLKSFFGQDAKLVDDLYHLIMDAMS